MNEYFAIRSISTLHLENEINFMATLKLTSLS